MIGIIIIAAGVFLAVSLTYLALGAEERAAAARRLKAIKRRTQSDRPSIEGELRKLALVRAKPRETFLTQFVPNRAALENRLRKAGKSWTAENYATAIVILGVILAAGLVVMGLQPLIAMSAGIVLGMALPHILLGVLIARRSQKFIQGFPVAIDLMARGIKSGLPISQTIEVIATELDGPVREEFQSVSDAVRIGRTMDEGLKQVAARVDMPEFQFFCIAIAVQRETGGNIGETLSNLSDVLRKRAQMKMKVKAISSEARTSSGFMALLPFLIVGAINVMNPGYLEPFLTNEKLTHVGIGACAWMVMGIAILVKMANFKI
jgi:tight adherence protein B